MKSYQKDYPRPQLVRDSWQNLNGTWSFLFDDEDAGERETWYLSFPEKHREIQVPFTYETKSSGIGEEEEHRQVWYERSVNIEDQHQKGHLLLHFEGVDFMAKLWVNGEFVGSHRGGYARFSFDITRYVHAGRNRITLKVEDSFSVEQPRGKQRWQKESFTCFYVQTTGIWKTVWLEQVSDVYLSNLKITPDLTEGAVDLFYEVEGEPEEGTEITARVYFGDTLIQESTKKLTGRSLNERIPLSNSKETPWGIHTWTPENPQLYDLSVTIHQEGETIDQVSSYFGMREISISNGNILLNGRPLYQRLLLDQGYWQDSHLTPPDEQALVDDIDKIQAMGYNGVRKHMKIEDERFLYWSDVKGLLVWSEMPAFYEFTDLSLTEFTREWLEIVRQNYSHPSIITWTPFNESWGIPRVRTCKRQQAFTEAVYYLTKSLDPMRPVIVNDGWEHTVSDIISLHDYEEKGEVFLERYRDHEKEILSGEMSYNGYNFATAEGFSGEGKPVIISEFGGIAFEGGDESDWGYGNRVATEEEFLKRFEAITTAIRELPYVSGYCYTQLSDVQQEVNGLLNGAHGYKIRPEKIRAVNEKQAGLRKL